MKLQTTETVQYFRPEIVGLVVGSFLIALATREYRSTAGSSPMTRFVLGFIMMIGALIFLGCPLRMVLRMAAGDLNAWVGLIGFVLGVATGTFFLKKGYSLKRSYSMARLEGFLFPAIQVVVFILLVAAPAFIYFTEAGGGPGAKHAAVLISLAAGLIVGALAQRTRLCMVGGIRDVVLFREPKLLMGFGAILISALVCNLILTGATDGAYFHLAFEGQPIAHTDGLWNCLGMVLVGFGCVLLGGCPLRQLVLSGEGSSDSAVTVLGLIVGAAFAHNFGLASSAEGPTANGKIAVVIGLAAAAAIGCLNTFRKKA